MLRLKFVYINDICVMFNSIDWKTNENYCKFSNSSTLSFELKKIIYFYKIIIICAFK